MSKRAVFFLYFSIWFLVGGMLLYKGVEYLMESVALQLIARDEQPLLGFFTHLLGSPYYALMQMLFASLAIGYVKGFLALKRSTERLIRVVQPYGEKIPLAAAFPWWYVAVMVVMMGLGMAMKFAPLYSDVRGMIDVAVGFALLSGSTFFLRAIASLKPA